MGKIDFKPGNMLYPLPVVMVSVSDGKGKDNIVTVAWAGTICSDPAMVSISVRKERYSHKLIEETGEFIINLTTRDLVWATDYCGVTSGRDLDKWEKCGLTKIKGSVVNVPYIEESPVAIECKVKSVQELGTHDMFIAEVVAVHVDDKYMNEKGTFKLENANPIAYSHGRYYDLGAELGSFGYSIRK